MKGLRILFLTYRIARGFGVDVVVLEQARRLSARGYDVHVACIELLSKQVYDGIKFHEVLPGCEVLQELVKTIGPTLVVAHTEPWMGLLAKVNLPEGTQKWIWEHGDPTPTLIPEEQGLRQAEKDQKLKEVYPKVDKVFAISEFVRKDIRWPSAQVIYNGIPDLFSSQYENDQEEGLNQNRPLRVGSLMRLGKNEALYKGRSLYLELVSKIRSIVGEKQIEFAIMGRGSEQDAEAYRSLGITVYLNASEEEKFKYLKNLDVFFSPSQWEGFNLPLIEAQSLGVHSVAFDRGAHPEVCPFVFSGIDELALYLSIIKDHIDVVKRHGSMARRFVKSRFSFDRNVDLFELALEKKRIFSSQHQFNGTKLFLIGIKEGIRLRGYLGFFYWFIKKIARKILN